MTGNGVGVGGMYSGVGDGRCIGFGSLGSSSVTTWAAQKDLMFVASGEYEAENRLPDKLRQFGLYHGDHFPKHLKIAPFLRTYKLQNKRGHAEVLVTLCPY